MKKLLLALLVVLYAGATVFAQDIDPSQRLPIDKKVKIGQLENGITYYIRNNPKPEDKVELRLVINAGSILETDKQLGLAHFMEHMNFNGTKNFKKNDLVDYLQSIGVKFGADLNAYTSFDETVYILPIPSDDPDKLEKGFQVLEDWAHQATLTEEDIDEERGVVLEEYRLGLGSDKRMMKEYLPKLMYGSRYADRLPIGSKEVLENFNYDVLRDYYKDWYRPDLMAVIAVGDLSVEEMESKIKKHFAHITKAVNPKKREEYDLPNHKETFISIASDKEAPFSNVEIYYKDHEKAKVTKTYGDYYEDMVESLFSTMLNSRLSEIRNSNNPPFVFANTFHGGTFARSKNAFQSFAFTGPEDQLRAFRVLLEENERVKQHGFNEGELERAKKSLMARMEKAYNDRDKTESERLIGEYIRNFLEQEPIPGIEEEYKIHQELLGKISLEEVNQLINNFLHDDNRVIIFTGPEKEDLEKVTEEQVQAVLQEVESATIAPYDDEEIPEKLIQQLPPKGSVVERSSNKDLNTQTLVLSNGAKVTYKKTDFKNDEILFSAYSPGGLSLYSDEELQATAFANGGLASAGIGGYSLTDLQKFMSGKLVFVRPSISSDGELFSGSTAPKDMETLFQMVHLYFTDLNKDEEAYQSYVSKQKGFLGNILANPGFYFSVKLGDHRNKNNPRYTGFPSNEKYDAADYDLAYEKYLERFADAGDFHFFFVGNIDEKLLEEYCDKYLASLPGKNSQEKYQSDNFRLPDQEEIFMIKKGEEPKSTVRIIWEEELTEDEGDKLAIDALGEVLTIKLIETLREEEAGVYGISANGDLRKRPYRHLSFSISFPCGPENVDKLSKAALAEVEKIKKQGVQEKDLNKVKEAYLVEHKEAIKTNRFWLDGLVKAERESTDPNKMLSYEKKVTALNAKQLQELAKEYLDDQYIHAILLPEETE
jgi:zinc protease